MSERATEGQVVMPFYIVCDVSGSMCGDMADLNAGVAGLRQEIMKTPSPTTWRCSVSSRSTTPPAP